MESEANCGGNHNKEFEKAITIIQVKVMVAWTRVVIVIEMVRIEQFPQCTALAPSKVYSGWSQNRAQFSYILASGLYLLCLSHITQQEATKLLSIVSLLTKINHKYTTELKTSDSLTPFNQHLSHCAVAWKDQTNCPWL